MEKFLPFLECFWNPSLFLDEKYKDNDQDKIQDGEILAFLGRSSVIVCQDRFYSFS